MNNTYKPRQEPPKGLVNLRNSKHSTLTLCTNCNCKRYGPCGCEKKGEKKAS